jgi:hypothetical protein
MDQIDDSRYPIARSTYSISSTLFYAGLLLFTGAPINYICLGNAEQTMLITAYSFFFFLASGLISVCGAELHDSD